MDSTRSQICRLGFHPVTSWTNIQSWTSHSADADEPRYIESRSVFNTYEHSRSAHGKSTAKQLHQLPASYKIITMRPMHHLHIHLTLQNCTHLSNVATNSTKGVSVIIPWNNEAGPNSQPSSSLLRISPQNWNNANRIVSFTNDCRRAYEIQDTITHQNHQCSLSIKSRSILYSRSFVYSVIHAHHIYICSSRVGNLSQIVQINHVFMSSTKRPERDQHRLYYFHVSSRYQLQLGSQLHFLWKLKNLPRRWRKH